MEVNTGYKQTELGVIPEEWDVVALGELATIERGKFSARPRNDPKYYGGETPFIQTGDITRSGGKVTTFSQTLNKEGIKVSRVFPRGTLFFTIAANIGDVGIADFAAACPDSLVAFSPHAGTEKKWLLYELFRHKESFEALASPGAQLNINLEKLRPFKVRVPTNTEQLAIAQALGDVDALIAALDRLIAKKRDIKQATMQQLLTGKTRLPGFSGKWEMKQLKDCAKFCSGSYLSQEEYIDGPFEIQGAGNTMGMHITANFHEPLTVIGRVGTVGRPRFMPTGCWVNNNAGAILANTTIATPFFVHLILCTMDWRKATSVTAQPFLVINSLMKMEFMLPDISEQVAISTVLADMDAELSALEARRDKTRALKQGMMQELLTGKTRLI